MKRRDLIRELSKLGCILIRHGSKHDWYMNSDTKISQPIPRHTEINEHLAKHIPYQRYNITVPMHRVIS